MTVVIRTATPADVETVVALRIEFLGAVRGAELDPSAELVERTRAFVVGEHRAGRLYTWLAADGSDPVGLVSVLLWPRPPQPEDVRTIEAYVINMYVRPAHQRRGLGRQLLDRCLAAADELGIRKFLLHSTDDGRGLYDSVGFTPKPNWMELPVRHSSP